MTDYGDLLDRAKLAKPIDGSVKKLGDTLPDFRDRELPPIVNPWKDAEEKTANQKEYKLQTHIIKKHEQYFPHVIITHVPNRPSSASDGHFKKQLGVRAGVSDLVLWWGYTYPAWAIQWLAKMLDFLGFSFSKMHAGVVELKVDSGIRGDQNKFMSAIHSIGGNEGVVRSWREYYHLLCSWKIQPIEACSLFDEPDYRTEKEKFRDGFDWAKP